MKILTLLLLTILPIGDAAGQKKVIHERVFEYTSANIYPGFSYTWYDTIKYTGENYDLDFFHRHFFELLIPGGPMKFGHPKENSTVWDTADFRERFNNNLDKVLGSGLLVRKFDYDDYNFTPSPILNKYYILQYTEAGQLERIVNRLDPKEYWQISYGDKGQIRMMERYSYRHLSIRIALLE